MNKFSFFQFSLHIAEENKEETESDNFVEANQYSDASEVLTNNTEENIAVNLSKTLEKEKEITTVPTIFSTSPNRYIYTQHAF